MHLITKRATDISVEQHTRVALKIESYTKGPIAGTRSNAVTTDRIDCAVLERPACFGMIGIFWSDLWWIDQM